MLLLKKWMRLCKFFSLLPLQVVSAQFEPAMASPQVCASLGPSQLCVGAEERVWGTSAGGMSAFGFAKW